VRITSELKPEHRARPLELAARKGEKGVSSFIAEALESYLAASTEQERLRKRASRLRGMLPPDEARRQRQASEALRESWR
jgi:hypothetical protein